MVPYFCVLCNVFTILSFMMSLWDKQSWGYIFTVVKVELREVKRPIWDASEWKLFWLAFDSKFCTKKIRLTYIFCNFWRKERKFRRNGISAIYINIKLYQSSSHNMTQEWKCKVELIEGKKSWRVYYFLQRNGNPSIHFIILRKRYSDSSQVNQNDM